MIAAHPAALAFVVLGCAFFLTGTLGLLRFPDTLSRLHALTKTDNIGLGFICTGLAIYDGSLTGVIRLFFIWCLALMASTVSAFLIARWSGEEADE